MHTYYRTSLSSSTQELRLYWSKIHDVIQIQKKYDRKYSKNILTFFVLLKIHTNNAIYYANKTPLIKHWSVIILASVLNAHTAMSVQTRAKLTLAREQQTLVNCSNPWVVRRCARQASAKQRICWRRCREAMLFIFCNKLSCNLIWCRRPFSNDN